jgi:hypothetical protein
MVIMVNWAIMVFMPLLMEIVLVFKLRMDDKVKDGIVLSVDWRWRDT